MIKLIKAYVGQNVHDDTEVIIDDYPNQDNDGELAVNLKIDNKFINLYRTVKDDGSVKFVIIEVDQNNKALTRYGVQEQLKASASNGLIEIMSALFKVAKESC